MDCRMFLRSLGALLALVAVLGAVLIVPSDPGPARDISQGVDALAYASADRTPRSRPRKGAKRPRSKGSPTTGGDKVRTKGPSPSQGQEPTVTPKSDLTLGQLGLPAFSALGEALRAHAASGRLLSEGALIRTLSTDALAHLHALADATRPGATDRTLAAECRKAILVASGILTMAETAIATDGAMLVALGAHAIGEPGAANPSTRSWLSNTMGVYRSGSRAAISAMEAGTKSPATIRAAVDAATPKDAAGAPTGEKPKESDVKVALTKSPGRPAKVVGQTPGQTPADEKAKMAPGDHLMALLLQAEGAVGRCKLHGVPVDTRAAISAKIQAVTTAWAGCVVALEREVGADNATRTAAEA